MMLPPSSTLQDYILELQSGGRISFTSEEATAALGIKHSAFQKSAARLQRKRLLFNPRHGFYVIVPPQYLTWEAPPPGWYIDDLMRHEGRAYYVGLQSGRGDPLSCSISAKTWRLVWKALKATRPTPAA